MRTETALRIIGGRLVLQGLLFYTFASPLSLQIFPDANDKAIHVGMVMRRGLAAMSILAGLVIFLVLGDWHHTTKRDFFDCGIGFTAISMAKIKILIDKAAVIPVPAIVIYSEVAILSLCRATRKHA